MDLLTLLFGALGVLTFLAIRYFRQNRGKLEHLGIPIQPSSYLFGAGPFGFHNIIMHDWYLGMFKKYGKTFGRYEGITPVINTIDPEIIKSITVKNFESFSTTFPITLADKHTTLDISSGERWRALRKALSPTFTSGKLKGMLLPMTGVADSLVEYVEKTRQKSEGGIVDMKACFVGLALDTISSCAFGVDTNANENPEQDLVKWGKEAFGSLVSTNWFFDLFFHIFFHFPSLGNFIGFIPPAFDHLHRFTSDLIRQRKEKGIKREDFVDRLRDIMESTKAETNHVLNDDIIQAQGSIFFVAGFETTSNTLSTLFYNLAKNPDVQEALYQEIEEVLAKHDGKLDQDIINDMKLLDACIQEDLRLMGPVLFHSRVCDKDCEVVPGFTVKKGTQINLNIYAAHHWPEYFPEPNQFRPERFMEEEDGSQKSHQYTSRPFGGGPRVCIGQRFAMVEMKIATVKLLQQYRVVATENTKLNFSKGSLFLLAYPDMKVKLEKRIDQ